MGYFIILRIQKIVLLTLTVVICLHANGQRQTAHQTNSWFMFFGSHRIAKKWSLHSELQWRRSEVVSKPLQTLFRTGINYHINADVFVTAGYAFVHTVPYGAFPARADFPENRLWEQIQLKNQSGAFEIISRLRIEQRWVNQPTLQNGIYKAGDAVYQNRFRLLNRITIPFKGKKVVDRSYYFTAFDELMLNAGKNVALNVFDQNRVSLAIGYKMPKLGRLEIGYMQQLVLRSDGVRVENNHTIMIGLSSAIDFYNPTKK